MNRVTLIVLSALVIGLGFLAYRQMGRDALDASENDVPLFVGLDENSVVGVRIDNIERDVQMSFERDPKVGWMMTDPVRVRAENSVLDLLVRSALQRRATPVPDAELDTKKLGLEPPRVVFELITKAGLRAKVEVGAVDLDLNRVHVRVRGRVVRAVRDFDTMLDLMLDEYKSHAATTLEPRDVVEVHRRGSVVLPGQTTAVDVALDAQFDSGEWRSSAPRVARLDPLAMSIMAQGGAGLRFDRFADTAGAPLSSLGLDPAQLEIVFTTARGESAKLRFGPAGARQQGTWNGTREGDTSVWRVSSDVVMGLATPVEEMLDHRLHRFTRPEIDAIQMSTQKHEVRLERGAAGWAVIQANAGSRVFGPPTIADTKRVEDFLGALDKQEVRTFLADTALDANEASDSLRIESKGVIEKCAFGRKLESGGVRWQREGDAIVGVVDEAWLELVRTPMAAFWSASIIEISEVSVTNLTLSRGEKQREFERDRVGLWVEHGKTGEARELHTLLDPLLFLRASAHLESNHDTLDGPIHVKWRMSRKDVDLVFGKVVLDGQPTVVCELDGRRSVLLRQDVYDMLEKLLE